MTKRPTVPAADLRGFSRLAIDGTARLTDLVEAMHSTIARAPGPFGPPGNGRTRGITGAVYAAIRGITHLVGGGLEGLAAIVSIAGGGSGARLSPLRSRLGDEPATDGGTAPGRDAVVAALNGVLGDYLAASENPLAIGMRLRRDGRPLELERAALAESLPRPTGRLLVLAHGLCLSDRQWSRQGHDHGAALARDLGFTPTYLHYNSGLHVSTNGRAFAGLLETLVREWPVAVEELAILGHSMGGLIARSACHYGRAAGHGWLRPLRRLVFLGTPHHGSALERGGNRVDFLLGSSAYTAPLARLGKIRSAGITDLRHGSLLDEDWEGRDRFALAGDSRRALPLPEGVVCYALAAASGGGAGALRDQLLGDGLVPLRSALGEHADPRRDLAFPESRRWVGTGMNHFDLLSHPEVYEQLRRWLAQA